MDEGIISEDEMNQVIDSVQKEMRAAHDKIDKSDKMDNPDMENQNPYNNHLKVMIRNSHLIT